MKRCELFDGPRDCFEAAVYAFDPPNGRPFPLLLCERHAVVIKPEAGQWLAPLTGE